MQTTEIRPTQQADPASSSRGYWRAPILFATALLALAGLWVTSDAWSDIYHLGTTDEESSHVLLAIPAALWIAWTRKTYTSGARRAGTWLGPALVAFGWLLYSYGDVQLFQSIWHFGAICIVIGCIVTMVGQEVFLRLWPAFAVLIFLIPVPAILRAQIAPPMQTVTAQVTAYLLQTFGEPVTLSGKVLIVNGVSVGIAEACNGIRMVFALALVCFFYAFSTELSARARFMIILASPLIAIAVNIVRLVPTVWLYGHTEVEFAEQFHDLMGWAMMPIALFGLIGLRALLSWALKDDPDAPEELKPSTLSGVRHSEV
jgi:exosortase